jgi:cytochrome c-type biogenesis protein CcmH
MILWVAFALMTAVAVFVVLWPLSRHATLSGGSDVEVYRDQLNEITRDRTLGLIGEAEAEAARIEVSRRMLAADASISAANSTTTGTSSIWRRRATAVTALVALPLGASIFYLALGSPELPGEPLAARLTDGQQDRSVANLISQVEAHLKQVPSDARGYEVLAPVYLRLGRFDDAVRARRKLLELKGESAERESDLGEALAAAANGIVTVEAKEAFERASALDVNDLKAKFFIGLAAEQDGDREKAAGIWQQMLEKAPAGAPWYSMVAESLKRVGGTPPQSASMPGPSAEDVATAANMSAQDRGEMIRGMVARLAERLKQNGNDIEGWQRLMRAYVVLGEREKAQETAKDAKRTFTNDPEKLRRVEDAIKQLGIQG